MPLVTLLCEWTLPTLPPSKKHTVIERNLMADPSAPRPLSIERHPLDTVGAPQLVPPHPTLIEKTEESGIRSSRERPYAAARKTLLDTIARARRNFRYMAEEKPMQLVLGIAIASFLAGVGLRLWRSHYE